MEMTDQKLSFGDFSGLEGPDFEKVDKILRGRDGPKRVEFPWNTQDPNFPEVPGEENQPGFCPVDTVPPMAGAAIFVPSYPVPAGMYPVTAVPAVVGPYPMVNGIALGQPYPHQPVPVPRETIYPQTDGSHLAASPPSGQMCNGPTVGVACPVYNHEQPMVPQQSAQQCSPVPESTQPTELDFVYSDPGSEVPVSTSNELIQHSLSDNSPDPAHGSSPARTNVVENVEQQMENVSIDKSGSPAAGAEKAAAVAGQEQDPVKKDTTPEPPTPTSPPPKKSWAGLFKGNNNAIVTYVDDFKKDPSPQPIPPTVEKKVEEAAKMPVPVAEDSAAVQLGEMLKSVKINHASIALQPRGLVNRGNWCYINATLQALLACPPFYHLMRQLCEFPPLARGSSSTPILDSLIAFFKNFSLWVRNQSGMRGGKKVPELSPGSPFEPVNVYKMLQVIEANPSFKLGKQEDAEEFLNCILDGLHEEMATSISQANGGERGTDEVQENGYVDEDNASEDEEDSWQQVGPKKKSVMTRRAAFAKTPIADIFAGHIRSAVYKAASKESATLEPFFTLKLDIQDEKIWTVRDALDGLVSRESVQGYQCSKTNQEMEIGKKISLEELPPVLILHLKCFVFDKTGGSQKLQKKIDFDVDLNITKEWLSSTAKAKIQHTHRSYKLFAVVFHHGKSSTGGHYTTDVFHAGINSWVHIDDSRIQSVPVSAVQKYTSPRMPYLLYYRRTDLS